jgi:uncharacterized protein YprB with RNaseH-like and TPR domain
MDLRDKLRQFDSDFQSHRRKSDEERHSDVETVVAGDVVSNEWGSYFRSITVFPEDHLHGQISLDVFSEVDPATVGLVGSDEALSGVDLRKAIFIDTETTGLAGGTGTVPFLIGLGYFYDDGFRVDQYFMRDYQEEPAILRSISERLENCDGIVSYNGKAYDLNILASRFILTRMDNPARELPHLDLLFTARRLWRRRIADCSLSNVERAILGFHRSDDIPSFMIPGLYFDYLRSRNGNIIEPVFSHNRWDIVTLVALAGIAGRIYQSPREHLDHPLDFLSLGRALERLEHLEDASTCYREALNYSMENEDRDEVLRHLGFSLKRLGDWERAVKVWEHMVESTSYKVLPLEELAKYYEHRVYDFEKAIDTVHRTLKWISMMEELRPSWNLKEDRKDMEYRLARLERKKGLGKQK